MRSRATSLRITGNSLQGYLPSLDLQFAADKTLTARKGPTPAFTRGSGATQVNASGLIEYAPENLLLRSDDFGNATWQKFLASVTTNTAASPSGVTDADTLIETATTGQHYTFQTITKEAGSVTYCVSVYYKNASGTRNLALALTNGTSSGKGAIFTTSGSVTATNVNIGGGAGFTFLSANVESVGNGWYRASITVSSDAATRLDAVAYLSNSTSSISSHAGDGVSSIYLWGAQLERNAVARTYNPTTASQFYAPRFDHDPVTLACKGLLIEDQRTNLCLRSEEFDNPTWSKSSAIVTAPVVTANQVNSPSGVLNADRIVLPVVIGTGAYSLANQFFSQSAGVVYTASIYLRGLVGGEKVWWSWTPNGSTYARKECILTTAWQRFDFTYTSTAGNNFIQLGVDLRDASQSAQSAQTIFAWGAQLEAGSFPTSYIPTTSATAPRSADVCSITGSAFTSFYKQPEGTLFADATPLAISQLSHVLGLNTTGLNNAHSIWKSNSAISGVGLRWATTTTNGSSPQSLISTTTDIATISSKLSYAYKTDDMVFVANGSLVGTDTSGTMPTSTAMRIGSRDDGTGFYLNGHIASVRYYKKRLSNAKLQSLTTP